MNVIVDVVTVNIMDDVLVLADCLLVHSVILLELDLKVDKTSRVIWHVVQLSFSILSLLLPYPCSIVPFRD